MTELELQAELAQQAETRNRIDEAEQQAKKRLAALGLTDEIEVLDSFAVFNALKRIGITQVSQLMARSGDDLRRAGLHRHLVERTRLSLEAHDLTMADTPESQSEGGVNDGN